MLLWAFLGAFFAVLELSRPLSALAPESHRVELFMRGVTTVPFEENDGSVRERAAHSYRIPSLVDVGGVMVAIADARYVTSNDNSFIETAVKYSVDNGKTWETQIAIKSSRVRSVSRVVDPTVLVNGNRLYVLVGSYNRSTNYWTWHKDGSDWEPFIAVGEVTKSTVQGNTTANIKWRKPVSLNYIRSQTIAGSPLKQFLGGVSGAVVTSNGTFLIPVQVTNMAGKIYATMVRSDDEGNSWTFSKGLVGPGYSEPAVVEWEGRLIMSVRYDYNYRMVYESRDMGGSWTEALGTLSRVWGTSPRRNQPGSQSSFIAVTIEGRRVMLFTHPLNTKGKWLRDKLHLWLTDGNRIHDVGQVSVGNENSAYSSLLYKDGKLYCLHEINTNEVYSLVFAELIGELERIKRVVRGWKRMDDKMQTYRIPTDGLVGFLSGNLTEDPWEDAYFCVNATVENGASAKTGGAFNKTNLLAEWPVSKQGQNQRYYFANHAFSLVVTVIIHEVPERDIPLLGVALDSRGSKRFGLSCTKDQRWGVSYGSGVSLISEESWSGNTEHQVALIMSKGYGHVYVDGELLNGSSQKVNGLTVDPGISHFYLGAAGDGATRKVTLANAVLYNRQLDGGQLNALVQVKKAALNEQIGDNIIGTADNSSAAGDPGSVKQREHGLKQGEFEPQVPQSHEFETCGGRNDFAKSVDSSIEGVLGSGKRDALGNFAKGISEQPTNTSCEEHIKNKNITNVGSKVFVNETKPSTESLQTAAKRGNEVCNSGRNITSLQKNNNGDCATHAGVIFVVFILFGLFFLIDVFD